jgi:hypothetical protein
LSWNAKRRRRRRQRRRRQAHQSRATFACYFFLDASNQINYVDFEIGFLNSANVKTLLLFEKF